MKIRHRQNGGMGIIVVLAAVVFLAAGILPSTVGAAPWSDGRGKKGAIQGKRHHGRALGIWRNQQAIEQLELTEKQIDQLRDAEFTSREKSLAMKAKIDQMRLQMERAFTQGEGDQKSIRQLAQQIAEVKGQLFVRKIEDRLMLGTILTSDQIQKLDIDSLYRKKRGPGGGQQRSSRNRGRFATGYGDGDCRYAR